MDPAEKKHTLPSNLWSIGSSDDREYWNRKYEAAKRLSKSKKDNKSVLIEVAAQHPLTEGTEPNEEFSNRLLVGIDLYKEYIEKNYSVILYVPGSRHMDNGIVDEISLSQAGTSFLTKRGIPAEVVHGDDLNQQYKGERGVYSSADECFVAASYYNDNQIGQLISVVSPLQVIRKMLFYVEFGVYPLIYSVPVVDTYHNLISEVFDSIPYVLFKDHNMQDEDSAYANELRRQRKPKV